MPKGWKSATCAAGSGLRLQGKRALTGTLRKAGTKARAVTTETLLLKREWTGTGKMDIDQGDTVISVAVSKDQKFIAAGGVNRKVNVYTTRKGELFISFQMPGTVNTVTFSHVDGEKGPRLYIGTFNGVVVCKHVFERVRARSGMPHLHCPCVSVVHVAPAFVLVTDALAYPTMHVSCRAAGARIDEVLQR